jgi:predicted anti-sigma-YlaC factor YlaD
MMEHEENRELTCREVVELVTDYLEDALLPDMHTAVTEHVTDCPDCSAYYAQMQHTIAMLRQLTREPAFPETKEALLQKFREWRGG